MARGGVRGVGVDLEVYDSGADHRRARTCDIRAVLCGTSLSAGNETDERPRPGAPRVVG